MLIDRNYLYTNKNKFYAILIVLINFACGLTMVFDFETISLLMTICVNISYLLNFKMKRDNDGMMLT